MAWLRLKNGELSKKIRQLVFVKFAPNAHVVHNPPALWRVLAPRGTSIPNAQLLRRSNSKKCKNQIFQKGTLNVPAVIWVRLHTGPNCQDLKYAILQVVEKVLKDKVFIITFGHNIHPDIVNPYACSQVMCSELLSVQQMQWMCWDCQKVAWLIWTWLGPAVGSPQIALWWAGAAGAATDRSQGNHSTRHSTKVNTVSLGWPQFL